MCRLHSNKDNNPKEGPLPVATQNLQPKGKAARKFPVRTSGSLTDKRGYHQVRAQYQSQSMSNRNSNQQTFFEKKWPLSERL
jgi:hypothetical protein